jgi:trans-aconitate methyltransferase
MSWFQARPETSLELIRATGMGPEGRIIDVGGGVSRLPDALLARGFSRLAVLDLSPTALAVAQERLGVRAVSVEWLMGDVRSFEPPHPFDVWHDRAVFHFLTNSADRLGYRQALLRTVPGVARGGART